ncbi:hypothetical protein RHMOL_Rhmol01G0301200 [Rhododendron molle]|uniref:Uncharacterized protein n=1 Tax=Rhododendron molle TaxID=49168 RepID=A0ACC0Q7P5_RHOML|nr:hypothetical protein RHMOL_Rhmol01G0301200 [Rhododendron molle]
MSSGFDSFRPHCFFDATMTNEGEKTCPLCAEEMDLTDQQLKPCKCGYEICVWCWHHLMDMAEKDETEGRCPACRTPYNKEKIVGMTSNCERLVAEMNMEKKVKLQRTKSKTLDGRKHLSNVRVIQRNLVYIVGLPLDLVDEDLLQGGEYFGQYGKVLKVSISRTAAGSIQPFANNTCSVACFGTTKYCHAWLRNMPCGNPDCLYLHEIGTQEDSFTKDEIISAYTRSRVQQITGATINMQRRSGNVLPPPADEYYINGSATSEKPITKSASNNPTSSVRGSPPNSSSGQSAPLPAAASWGPRVSNCHQPPSIFVCANGPSKQKPEAYSGSTAVASTTQVPLLNDDARKKLISHKERQKILHSGKKEALEPDRQLGIAPTTASEGLPVTSTLNGQLHSLLASEDKDRCISTAPYVTHSFDLSGKSNGHVADKDQNVFSNGNIQNTLSRIEQLNFGNRHSCHHSGDTRPNCSHSDNILVSALPKSPHICVMREHSDRILNPVTREESDWKSESHAQVADVHSQFVSPEVLGDSQYFDDQRFKDPEVLSHTRYLSNSSPSSRLSYHSRSYSPQQKDSYGSTSFKVDPQISDDKNDKGSLLHTSDVPIALNRFPEDRISCSLDPERTVDDSYLLPLEPKKKHVGRFEGEAVNADQNTATGMGESSIISNILSMNFDSWEESLTSPQNLAKLLGEDDRHQGSLKLSSCWKVQNSNQSRFSFARLEEGRNQVSDVEPSSSNIGLVLKDRPLSHDFPKHGDHNGSSTCNIEESDNFASSHSHISSNKLFGELRLFSAYTVFSDPKKLMVTVSRAQISAPPGFSGPSRAPPPGFTERMEPTFDAMSGNHFLDPSSLLRNPYQVPTTENITGDLEFMDPAILAVGRGRLPPGLNSAAGLEARPNYASQLNAFGNEASLQLLIPRSLPPLQNQRFSDMGNGFSPLSDAYRIPSRIMEQTQTNTLSPFAQHPLQQSRTAPMVNGQWGRWNEVQNGNDLGMAELLRTEVLGLNKIHTGYEDSKFRMPSSEHTCGNRCPCLREKKLSPSRSDFRDCRLVKASNRLKTGCQKPAEIKLLLLFTSVFASFVFSVGCRSKLRSRFLLQIVDRQVMSTVRLAGYPLQTLSVLLQIKEKDNQGMKYLTDKT